MRLERNDGDFCIDAALLGELLALPAAGVQALLRSRQITSVCERGEGEHQGQHRLTFFYKGRRARLDVDQSGRILKRSTIDLGEHPRPRAGKERRDALPLWRIHPVAQPTDSRWQGRRIWAEVIVRAQSAAMARLIASKLDEPPVPSRIGNETLCFRSGIEDEKLYWVRRLSTDEAFRHEKEDRGAGVIAAVPLGQFDTSESTKMTRASLYSLVVSLQV